MANNMSGAEIRRIKANQAKKADAVRSNVGTPKAGYQGKKANPATKKFTGVGGNKRVAAAKTTVRQASSNATKGNKELQQIKANQAKASAADRVAALSAKRAAMKASRGGAGPKYGVDKNAGALRGGKGTGKSAGGYKNPTWA